MEIDTLKLFTQVMRHGSFTAVASERRIAPSSVSRAIANLENDLGTLLFQRSTRKLSPTEQAVKFFDRIEPLIDEFEAAKNLLTESEHEPVGNLRVSVSAVYGQRRIVPLLKNFRVNYPGITIELIFNDHFVDLIDERIDLAIRLGKLSDSALVARRLHDMKFHVCASRDYLEEFGKPVRPSDIKAHECLLFPRGDYNLNWRFLDKNNHVEEIEISGNCMITNSDSIRECALAGMGLALLPDWLVADDLSSGNLVSVLDSYPVTATDFDSAAWIVYPSRRYLPLKTRLFSDFLLKELSTE